MDMPFDALSDVSDDALLIAFGNGDAASARALTLRLTPKVLGYAARLLRDRAEAEDVAQEAMLRLWKIAPEWRQGEAKVTTWLYRVVTNLCTDRLRKKRGNALDEIAEPEDDRPSQEAVMIQRERIDALNAALATLPDRQREAVVLRHIEGLGNPEIAEVLDISVEAVESLTARGKRALTQALAAQRDRLGFEDDAS
ncbi:RNA polymerase sigma factor [Celeribacter baekdonensis]|jgi:RNA polymerase sigma-70 factor (ECF subfamily)|uniref:RNA polymerase sigma factor n=2 Tax=Roseobacteraceae TaxID=2854170 RepID=K2J4S6_9RHOB|nr:RNA polymerase sigma factor [Celeribacter baekdonensis]EKE70038.1 RNA polymerase sigma factor [Celeribacter baekdonensis B30]|tara:strand:- start:8045 stop:8635 length:591 start_codon:yes stop_codon:yes gene_type:complete